MDYRDGMVMAEDLLAYLSPACDQIVIVGSLRRRKQEDVGDIEFLIKPRAGRPAPMFGQHVVHNSHLDKLLYELQGDGRIAKVKGKDRYKQYTLDTTRYGLSPTLNPFHVEFYIVLPPAQWGVGMVIRTGPNHAADTFSKWCVTNISAGGGLRDGYKVKHLGVWTVDQLDGKGEPKRGENPLLMPTEVSFLDFLGLGWVDPWDRHARWGR